ncbi:SDR family NAD(P)-dependent oxidoreductase [Novosphingobium sp. KACC 22771]|uniref:SDR family NAD(P)-dependent oxidoreductase n=1 Tax=Novosphingobium sp. KACC 22771 TaxID=3025670 RepID=UPI0023666DE1|nr:SDR family NAD(P)-dependent oxidoreductase [Novosphingobium sp. KACC 22771]WDF74846.1 SDR family NAD(P)-dependent oxidoreductase [Novosphingobium sp. KACC 22771]
MSQSRLGGRTALITGAGLGIGRAAALRLAQEGAALVLADRDEDRLRETAALLGDAPYLLVPCDVTSEAQVADLFSTALDWRPLDILVNNVGGGRSGRIADLSLDDWEATMALSLRSMFLCTRAAVPGMTARGYGRIVCLSSGARNGTVWNAFYTGSSPYSTAKAGVIGFVRALAIELGDTGITINAVAPGPIDTELAGPYLRAMDDQGLEYAPSRMVPMHRLGTAREVADAILFLASDEASYITGTTLDVAGGR